MRSLMPMPPNGMYPDVIALANCMMSGSTPQLLEGEEGAGAAEAGDDLVGDEQHVVAVADLADAGEVVVLGHDDPARPCTGSARNIATVSGPSRSIARSSSSAAATPWLTPGGAS